MAKAIVIILDSLGIGSTNDADKFGDTNANTLRSITKWRANAKQPLKLPNLIKMGIAEAEKLVSGDYAPFSQVIQPQNSVYAAATELSYGKDTPSGHWELMGCPVQFDWGYFSQKFNDPNLGLSVFPPDLMGKWLNATGLKGSLGNCHASGTEIIKKHGLEHIQTGLPICYTSADSVFQIAAHEQHFGLQPLYRICETAKDIFDEINIARVIARPFVGDNNQFQRTGNRKDYTTPPPAHTLLDLLIQNNQQVIGIGKISDIFAKRGVSSSIKADGLLNLCQATIKAYQEAQANSLIFTNLVDFDSYYGHRRDVSGYADALELFDQWLPQLTNIMTSEDLLVISADHGCDPTWSGTDHTREHVPILFYSKSITQTKNAGIRSSFADLGQSLAKFFKIDKLEWGQSFI